MSQSTVALPSDASASALPFHVLMVPSVDQQLQRRHLFEQRLEKDFIARRYKSLQQNPPSQESPDAANTTNGNAPQLPPAAAIAMDVWKGTLDVERSLVECCEVPASWEEASNGGALAKGKEVNFLGLLASCCNDVGTRALALAILERSIRKDEKELEEDEQQPRFDEIERDSGENSEGELSNDGENSEEEATNDESKSDRESDSSSKASIRQEDGSTTGNGLDEFEQIGTTSQGISQDVTTQEINATDEQDQTPSPRSEGDDSQAESEQGNDNARQINVRQDGSGRIDVFLAAGGLSLLNHWFKDAISPVVPPSSTSSAPPVVGKKPAQPSSPRSPILKPAPTGPILLPLLSVLEKIPFDKKLVMETKINKQIRKLSKHVDAIVESYQSSEDLTDPVAGGLSVVEVKNAVDALKQTWEEQATASSPSDKSKTADPFAELKKKMAERLEILHRYEAGELPKPEWLARFDQPDTKESKKRKSKTSMTVLQARERQQECRALTKKLKEAQHEKVKLLNQLRERRNKKAEDDAEKAPARKTSKAKKVTWKDGLSISTGIKVHRLLEQVYNYDPYEFDDEEEEEDPLGDMQMADAGLEQPEAEDQDEELGDGTTADHDTPMEDDSSDQDLFPEY